MTGGLIGFVRDGSDITVANCNVASGNITGTGGDNFGGIIGATYNAFSVSIYDCCITDVTIEGSYAGGIAGNGQRANLYNCYFAGTLVPLEGPWGTYYGGITAYGMYYAVSCYSNQENSSADAYGGTYYAEEYLKSADFAELLNSNTYSDSIEWRYFPGKNGGYPFVTKKISIDDLLNVEGGTLEFVTDGDYPFEITTNPGNEIELVCASTNMGIDYSVSFIQTSVTGPGAITFDWMVSGTYYYDLLSVCLDIEDIFDFYPRSDASEWISGETGWISSSIGIPEGTHTITWIYSKYDYVDCYNDRGYLKNVAFVTGERNITVGYNSNWGTVEIESDDTVIGTTSGQASMGAVVELSAIPEDRYIFVCWKSPDGKIIFDTNYSFAMGAYDVYFEAVFAKALNIDISWYKNPPEGANGSSEDTPYIIDSVESLAGLAALVNDTTNDPEITDVVDFYGEYIKLNADIDLSDYYWTPIGIYNSFKGSFDGNGKTISGLAFDGAETYDVGLFGLVEEGSVKNLNVIMSAALDYEKRIGGIIGFIDNGSITNCTSNAGISAGDECQIGGIVGASVNSIIENCTSVVDIVSGSERAIGGITGSCYFSSVQNCTSSGIISGKVWCSSGGIAGDSYNAEFNFCISSCSITSGFGTLNGGIAGASYLGAFNNCLNSR